MVTCCISETTKDTCFGLLRVTGTMGALRSITSLLVAVFSLIFFPPVLSWAVDVIHSAQTESECVINCDN